MTRETRTGALLIMWGVLLLGCDLPIGGDGRTEVAMIPVAMLERPHLQIPDTVQAGEPIHVTITTAGPNGCYSAAGTDVRASAGVVRLTPFHRIVEGPCTDATVELKRTVEIPPRSPGITTVHVVARSGSADGQASVLAAHDVVVR